VQPSQQQRKMKLRNSASLSLANKTALITGGGGGFGAAIARLFVAQGANVVIADINFKKAQDLADELGSQALAVKADVTRDDDTRFMVARTQEYFGALDVFVANAGFTHRQMPLTQLDEEVFDLVLAVNIKALYYGMRAVVPLMKAGGSIITVGATIAQHPRPGLAWFCAAKGFVMSATKALAVELAPQNIRVNALCPAEADRTSLEAFYDENTQIKREAQAKREAKREALAQHIPLGRLTSGDDVAQAALWLASDHSSFTTGSFLPVDGGYHI